MRHAHYPIGVTAAERWLKLMSNALDSIAADGVELSAEQREAIWEHMVRAADMLINTNPDPHQQA